ncbi:Crp/Fnr family transcriptional regulator [Thalassospira alkalitolerans]|uniref:Crp/Fnr family transcriptional regulator n=1 Tax=Thalassospira alkalitolerans TaxID=1293890 RepID=A0A1Y2LAC3_9PROT|nr:Crp/Fnr family transcriptional regulator [Thalassospira alkalitolerans]OSQ47485.1 Crp/Fnr family transcriptional regulator [Thalassospira alkalitolerans]|tara:strand:- start:171263 stop:171907 length:645 start_codon:yes stop_codon:yes gene_type:complete
MNNADALKQLEKLAENPALDLGANVALGHHEDDGDHVYRILNGLVMQCHYGEDGERQVCRVFRPGDLIGLETVAEPGLPLISETLTATVLMRIPVARIRDAQTTNPELQHAILRLLAREVVDGYNWKINLGTGSAMRRICRFLLWSAKDEYCPLPTRDKLGSIIATTTETASRMIADLRRQGVLRKSRSRPATVVIDRDRVRQKAGDFWDYHAA